MEKGRVKDNVNVITACFSFEKYPIHFYLKQKEPQKILFGCDICQRQRGL